MTTLFLLPITFLGLWFAWYSFCRISDKNEFWILGLVAGGLISSISVLIIHLNI